MCVSWSLSENEHYLLSPMTENPLPGVRTMHGPSTVTVRTVLFYFASTWSIDSCTSTSVNRNSTGNDVSICLRCEDAMCWWLHGSPFIELRCLALNIRLTGGCWATPSSSSSLRHTFPHIKWCECDCISFLIFLVSLNVSITLVWLSPTVISGIQYEIPSFPILHVFVSRGPYRPSWDFKEGSPKIISSAPISVVHSVVRSI
jgi:hypothetical protein